ncbi:MAG: heavy-metal-associated domain-containing protein [Clostridiales Family XIII bacterium]|jgi:copper chaperone CopZ|nr:heavy-metal-associated domain-containing protein [Clostridiales Family XIII bacterium]
MKKIIEIKGMSCAHCQAAVEKALNGIDGVDAKVDLKKNQAIVDLSREIDDVTLKTAVEEAGYEVTSIYVKKGLFGN